MTALTADKPRRFRGVGIQVIRKYPILTATEIFKGAIVAVDAAGFLIAATDTLGVKVVGIAAEHVNNTGASGALFCEVTSSMDVLLTATGITQAMLHEPMYVEDSDVVDDKTGVTNHIEVGELVEFVSVTSGWVHIPDAGAVSVQALLILKSATFNIDNGAGTTIDDVIAKPSVPLTIRRIQAVYVTETTGTIAAGNVKLGTAIGGAQIAAATAYEDSKAIGVATPLTIVAGAVAADQAIHVRHTGVATTAAGQAFVEIEATVD